MSDCKDNANNFPPNYENYPAEAKTIIGTMNAQQQRLADAENDYILTNFNKEKENYNRNHGRAEGQSRDWNAPPAPEQPKEVCYSMDYSSEPWAQVKGETGNLLGEPYVYATADRPAGTIVFGPIVPELSKQPEYSVYEDRDSAVPLGTIGQQGDRWFRLVQDGESKRFWYQTSAPA